MAWGRIWILVGRIAPWDGVALGKTLEKEAPTGHFHPTNL